MISYEIVSNNKNPKYLKNVNQSLGYFLDYIVQEVNSKQLNLEEIREELRVVIDSLPIRLSYVDQMDNDMTKMTFTYHNLMGVHTQVVFNIVAFYRDYKLNQILS